MKRLFLISIVVCLLLAGLVAGVFANSIHRALTLPLSPNRPIQQAAMQTVQPMQPSATPAVPGVMPAMVLAADSFQRTDQQLWGIASGGRQWDGDANTQTAIFSIQANHGLISHGQGTFNALLGPVGTNMEALLDGSLNRFTGTANLGVVLRYNDPDNWYKALLDGTHLTLLKRVNKQTTQLTSVAFAAKNDRPYMLRFRIVGAMLFARAWATGAPEPLIWQAMATDNTFQSGQAGVRVVLQTGLTISVNTFSVTTASSMV